MKLYRKPFDMIANGSKTIELRLYDEKRRLIKVGDSIIFTATDDGEKITAEVLSINVFENFNELYNKIPLTKCGYLPGEPCNPDDMLVYYSKEQQQKFGVVGIELKVIV